MGDPGVEKLTRKGLSAFLAEHEECGGGFEVRRQKGSTGSIVRVICGGCGEPAEYPAASDEGLIVDQPVTRSSSRRIGRKREEEKNRPARNEGPRAGSLPPKDGAPRRRAQASSSVNWRSWLPGAIAGLIGGALVLIVIAIASGGGSDKGSSSGESANRTAPTAPATTPAATTQTPAPRRRSRASRLASNLDQRQLAERVSIGVPRGWSAGVSGGAVTLSARNGRAEVQVYYEPGARSQADLVNGSKRFLLQRHPGAHLTPVEPTDAGGRQARTVRVTYPGGTESATVLVAGGYSYLILVRLGKPSSAEARRTTEAVAMSFRPI